MNKKKIQEQRKKGYFIEAANSIIIEEGVENLTVKKVADLAGFASGTLYNYFEDTNELFAYCVADFWKDCKIYVLKHTESNNGIERKLITSCQAYVNYFLNNPNIFKLMFLKDFKNIPVKIKTKVYEPEIVSILNSYLDESVKRGIISEDNMKTLGNIIASFIHGILLFNIMERSRETKKEIQQQVEEHINFLLDFS